MKKLTKYILIGVVSLLAVSGATFGILQTLDTTNEPTGGDTPPVTVESYLSAPKNIELSLNYANNKTEYILSWDYVTHAEKFCITVGEKEFYTTEQTQQSYDISSAVTAGETYDIKVKAIGDGVKYGDSKNGLITEKIKRVSARLVFNELVDGTYSVAKKENGIINGELVLPDTYEGKEISEIPNNGFYETHRNDMDSGSPQKGITGVRFPKSLKKIGNGAFKLCMKLQEVVLPETIIEMGYSIFDYCKSLTSITFPKDMKIIPNNICRDCSLLKSVTLPSSLVEIGRYSFYSTGLEIIEIPETVTIIGDDAFSNTEISSIELPANIKNLNGFSYTKLTEVTIPATVETIGSSAFTNCRYLKKVKFEENSNLFTIDKWAFAYTGLTEIEIPNGVERIGSSSFRGTKRLKRVSIPESVVLIEKYAFADSPDLELVNLPLSPIIIEKFAFNKTPSLKILKIYPNSINGAKGSADYMEYLEGWSEITGFHKQRRVVIPKSVTEIGNLFDYWYNIGDELSIDPAWIYYKGTTEDWEKIEIAYIGTTNLTVYYYSQTEPPLNSDGTGYDGNYWYYGDDGVPVIWEYNSTEE